MRALLPLMAIAAFAQQSDPVYTQLTVTASRGAKEDAATSAQVVTVKERESIIARPAPTLGNALDGEPGVLVQQSTAGQVSPFLRGLTGYQLLNLIDGVRFNNSTFRSGPNQYLAFVEPSQASRIEAMLGPAGSQYGSDALGGAINVITADPKFSDSWRPHGELTLFGASSDWSSGGNAQVSAGKEKLWLLGGVSGRKHGDVRAGGGWDSRNVYHRLFGLSGAQVRSLVGDRQQDSGFSQYGFNAKLAARRTPAETLSLWYQRGALFDVRGYKDLLGGLGRLQSSFEPQTLDFLYGRYEKLRVGPLDSLSGTVSLNQQVDGGTRQGLRRTDAITTDWNRVHSLGYAGQGTTQLGTRMTALFGGEMYDEFIASRRPGAVRPLYPDGSRYRSGGLFGQTTIEPMSRLRLGLGGRWTRIHYSAGQAKQTFGDLTFNTSASFQATKWLGLSFLAGRGFRAPNLNDLGSLGLNDLGFEIPASDSIPAGALLGNSSGEGATSLGRPVAALRAESLYSYEAGFRISTRKIYARVHFFDSELSDPIVRRTMLFPAASVPSQLGGIAVRPVTPTPQQQAQGVLTVATQFDPRAVKAFVNDGRSRYYGTESLLRAAISSRWMLNANYAFLVGRDLDPNRNIRRLPPQTGALFLRYTTQRRYWVETGTTAAGAQRRLSGGDIDDERIGASRRRQDIADFFNGARVAPLLDGAGRFTPTGETLRQIQDRVLPGIADSVRVPLYTSTAGWVSAAIRAGVPLGEHLTIHAALENLFDRQYRVHGSGIDSSGRNAYLGIRYLW